MPPPSGFERSIDTSDTTYWPRAISPRLDGHDGEDDGRLVETLLAAEQATSAARVGRRGRRAGDRAGSKNGGHLVDKARR